ncbi:hypothetical protein XANCAGTX0491_005771 [Xanthoria calcicola]
MRPLDTAEIERDLLKRSPLLLLNTTEVAIRFVIQLVVANQFPVLLPAELWLDILDHYHKSSPPKYEAVRPTALTVSSTGRLLYCRTIKLNLGDLVSEHKILAQLSFDSFHPEDLTSSNRSGTQDTNPVYAIEFPRTATTTSVSSSSAALRVPDCLFVCVTVPDVIARLDGGRCWVCNGWRDICAGCAGVLALDFNACMGRGADLACPRCMGLEFMRVDKAFLQKYYCDQATAEEEEARTARLSARLAELGYDQKRASKDGPDGGCE